MLNLIIFIAHTFRHTPDDLGDGNQKRPGGPRRVRAYFQFQLLRANFFITFFPFVAHSCDLRRNLKRNENNSRRSWFSLSTALDSVRAYLFTGMNFSIRKMNFRGLPSADVTAGRCLRDVSCFRIPIHKCESRRNAINLVLKDAVRLAFVFPTMMLKFLLDLQQLFIVAMNLDVRFTHIRPRATWATDVLHGSYSEASDYFYENGMDTAHLSRAPLSRRYSCQVLSLAHKIYMSNGRESECGYVIGAQSVRYSNVRWQMPLTLNDCSWDDY